jgi:hypothetical protein
MASLLTLSVHGGALWFALSMESFGADRKGRIDARNGGFGHGLCGLRRCPAQEVTAKRRPAERGAEEEEVIEAALIPALGAVNPLEPQPAVLRTYEQVQVHESGVNLSENPEQLKELTKEFDARSEKRDRDTKDRDIPDLEFREDDRRKKATAWDKMYGVKEGDVYGDAFDVKAGDRYIALVRRNLRRAAQQTDLSCEALRPLKTVIKIHRIGPDGTIGKFSVRRRSGVTVFDNSAIEAVRQFTPSEGGFRQFDAPPPDVLGYVNRKSITVHFRGDRVKRCR